MLCIITCLIYAFSKLMFFLFFIGNFDIFYCSNYFLIFYYCRFYLFFTTILSKLHQHPISSRLILSHRDGTKPIPGTRSIGYRFNFKVSVSPIIPMPIQSTFRYYFDTFSQTLHPRIL